MSEPTYAQEALGLTATPSDGKLVQRINELYSEIIDICDNGHEHSRMHGRAPEAIQLFAMASVAARAGQDVAIQALQREGQEPERALQKDDGA